MATKMFTYEEIKKQSDSDNATLIVIHNSVYNVTAFLNEVRLWIIRSNSNKMIHFI